MDPNIRYKLIHALTDYDRKMEAKAAKDKRYHHNIYALAHYFRAVDVIEIMVDKFSVSLGDAIVCVFNQPFQKMLYKSVGLQWPDMNKAQHLMWEWEVRLDNKQAKHKAEDIDSKAKSVS